MNAIDDNDDVSYVKMSVTLLLFCLDFMKPSFVTQPKDKDVVAGSTALFELKIFGKPFPEVCWFHNNVQLSQGGRVQMTSSEGPQGGEVCQHCQH